MLSAVSQILCVVIGVCVKEIGEILINNKIKK